MGERAEGEWEKMKRFSERWRRPLSSRAVLTSVLTAVVVFALAAMGGLGHASVGGTASSVAQYGHNDDHGDKGEHRDRHHGDKGKHRHHDHGDKGKHGDHDQGDHEGGDD